MPVVTLTTDWGIKDHYTGAMKGALLSAIPSVTLIDISTKIPPYDIAQAAFIFSNSYHYFPKGTLHFISVNSSYSPPVELLAIKHKGYFFIGNNDGFFTMIFNEEPEEMVLVDPKEEKSGDFMRSTIINSIAEILNGQPLESLGKKTNTIVKRSFITPVTEEKMVRGNVTYIDEYGNVITNIRKELFEESRKGRKFEIDARRQQYIISEISPSYEYAGRGNLLALFNSAGFLEIAINQGPASSLLGMKYGDPIRIAFL